VCACNCVTADETLSHLPFEDAAVAKDDFCPCDTICTKAVDSFFTLQRLAVFVVDENPSLICIPNKISPYSNPLHLYIYNITAHFQGFTQSKIIQLDVAS
jgi:hypothetical protein